jgi:hypothetical protein
MRRLVWIGSLLMLLVAIARVSAGDAADPGWLQRWHPVGGWEPYGGGLLHWWNPSCFPCCNGPDDYCRKKFPDVCWPAYPPYFQWGKTENCCPLPANRCADCDNHK